MIDIPVVLVLGAGASHPYGFPLGGELVDLAINYSDGLRPILAQFHASVAMQLDDFLRDLDAVHPTSIDAFLEAQHPNYQRVGKAVIAYHLMQNECETKRKAVQPEEDWYRHFLHEIVQINDYNNIGFSNIAILTYNYDRSLEHTILTMLHGLGHSKNDCLRALERFYIRHLHGQIGYLPEIHSKHHGRYYEPTVDAANLKLAMDGIRVIHEPVVENDPVFFEPYIFLRHATNVIFLGFGYLDKNVERLNLQDDRMKNASYWGTGVKVTPKQAEFYAKLFPPRPKNSSDQTRITIDTKVTSVLDYLLNNPHLFRQLR